MKGLIFTYLLTGGGAIGGLFNPFIGLLSYISLAIIIPHSMWFWSVPIQPYSRIVGGCMLVGWVFQSFGRWELKKAAGITGAFVGFLVWAMLSSLSAMDKNEAWDYVYDLSKIVLPFLVGITLIDSVSKLKQLAWVIMLSQGLVAFEMNLAYYEGYNRMREGGFGYLDNNSLAIAAVTGVALAFFLGVASSTWWQRLIAWTCALLMAHSVMFSFSRGGFLALIVSAIVMFIFLPFKNPKIVLAFIVVILIGVRLAGPEVVERFSTTFSNSQERDESASSRLDLWADNFDVMINNPILGIGPNHWPLVAAQYGWAPGKEGHSLWFQTGAELGFPGVGLLLLFYLLCMKRLITVVRDKREETDPWLRDSARMVIASLAGFIVAAQFVSLERLEIPYYVNLLGAGTLLMFARSLPSQVVSSARSKWSALQKAPAFASATVLFKSKP